MILSAINNYRKNENSILHTVRWQKVAQRKMTSYKLIKSWYESLDEDGRLEASTGMLFGEILENLCDESSYTFCKNFIENHPEFSCIKDYKNIAIPPYYYPQVKHFMEHTFLFWLWKKVKYKISKVLMFLAQKFNLLLRFYKYVVYVKIRGYKKPEN